MTNPFEHNPFDSGSSGTQFAPPPARVPRDEVNALATLSVVFAFVFAPAGAVLGHLGLSQIRRTGERGRDRALVGVTLSYVFITAAVVALVVGATLAGTTPARIAAPTATSAIPTTTTTTTPPPPTVAPADLDGLLPSLADVKNITGDQALAVHSTAHRLTIDPDRAVIDRPDCWSVLEFGNPEAYDLTAVVGYSESDFLDSNDRTNQWSLGGGVAAFHDGTAAQAQLAKLQSIWRQCGGSTTNETFYGRLTYPVSMKPPADAGNGITTMETVTETPTRRYGVRAIAAKANVVVDVGAWSSNSTERSRQAALDITNYILGKISG
jgi:eukaryotic-like serine/threonine-protein kinase